MDWTPADGRIAEAALWSDGLDADFLSRVPALLTGCPLTAVAIAQALRTDPESTDELVAGLVDLLTAH